MVTRTTDNEVRTQEGFGWDSDGTTRTAVLVVRWMLALGQFTGHHEWESLHALTFDWRYTIAAAYRDEPDRRTIRYDYDEIRDVWFFSNSPDGNQRIRSGLEDLAHDAGFDMAVQFDQWSGLKSTGLGSKCCHQRSASGYMALFLRTERVVTCRCIAA